MRAVTACAFTLVAGLWFSFGAYAQSPTLRQTPSALSAEAFQAEQELIYADTVANTSTMKLLDDRLIDKQHVIEALATELRASKSRIRIAGRSQAENAKLKAEVDDLGVRLAETQESFLVQLAEKDAAVATEISYLRDNIDHILQTPEGLLALQKINTGDFSGGAQILDDLNKVRAEARKAAYDKRYAIETAADERAVALVLLGKEPVARSIERYEQLTELDSGLWWDWITLDRLYQQAHMLDEAVAAAVRAEHLAYDDRSHSVSLTELGDILLVCGQLDTAMAAYQESLIIKRELVSDTDRTQALRDLSVSLSKVGNVYVRKGWLDEAMASYQQALSIARQLAADTGNAQAKRDVLVSLNKIGGVYFSTGRLDQANTAYQEGLSIARQLALDTGGSAQTQRDLLISLNKIGNVYMLKGNLDRAGNAYRESLSIARQLASDTGNAEAQRDLSSSLDSVGDIDAQQGLLDEAMTMYHDSLSIRHQLASDTFNTEAQRDLSICLIRVGDIYVKQNRLDQALTTYQESFVIRRQLASDPGNAEAQRDLAVILARLASIKAEGIGWQNVLDQLYLMKSRGQLGLSDAWMIYDATQKLQ